MKGTTCRRRWGFDNRLWGFDLASRRGEVYLCNRISNQLILTAMFKLFVAGGPVWMSVLTVLLVAIFFAAWKAPRWVLKIGTFALTFDFLSFVLGITQMYSALQEVAVPLGDTVTGIFDLVSPMVLLGGLKVSLVPVMYGMIIYLVALFISIIQTPRL